MMAFNRFLMIGAHDVAFSDGLQELYTSLYFRHTFRVMVYADDDWNLLRQLAEKAQYRIYQNQLEEQGGGGIVVPPNINRGLCLTDNIRESNTNELSLKVNQGVWGVSALNGFSVVKSDEELCDLLGGGSMVYPIATVCESENEAAYAARNSYTGRFYSRYDWRYEDPMIPQSYLTEFRDACFKLREQRLECMAEEIRKAQENFLRRGW